VTRSFHRIEELRGPTASLSRHDVVHLDAVEASGACGRDDVNLVSTSGFETDIAYGLQLVTRSAARNSLDGLVFSAIASFATSRTVGFRTPRSTPET